MYALRRRTIVTLVGAGLAGLGLVGCSAATPSSPSSSSTTAKTQAPAAAAPADLTGEWKQSNSNSGDKYQAATIAANTITIYWISDNGDTKSLYWAGTYEPTTVAGSFTWTSQNDTSQTESTMLASSDPTKVFKFEKDEVSYSASALGSTTTVRLARQ